MASPFDKHYDKFCHSKVKIILFAFALSNAVFAKELGQHPNCQAHLVAASEIDRASPKTQDEFDHLALFAAREAYRAPNRKNRVLQTDLVQLGYTTYDSYEDNESGLYARVIQPSEKSPIMVVAFSGTKNWQMAASDISGGMNQYLSDTFWRLLADAEAIMDGCPNCEVLFTGHSIGGGLAQLAAYEFANARKNRQNQRIHLVTWNAYGAQDVVTYFRPELDSSVVNAISARNYVIDGDIVSHLGHMVAGPTIIVDRPDNHNGLFKRHLLTAFFSVLDSGTKLSTLPGSHMNALRFPMGFRTFLVACSTSLRDSMATKGALASKVKALCGSFIRNSKVEVILEEHQESAFPN